jgi:hypothetical protein
MWGIISINLTILNFGARGTLMGKLQTLAALSAEEDTPPGTQCIGGWARNTSTAPGTEHRVVQPAAYGKINK